MFAMSANGFFSGYYIANCSLDGLTPAFYIHGQYPMAVFTLFLTLLTGDANFVQWSVTGQYDSCF